MSNRRRAVTLIELVIVVLTIAILTSVAAPKFLESYQRQRVEAAAARIKADLSLARQTAIARSTTRSVVFDPNSHSYSLTDTEDLDRRIDSYFVDLSTAPYEVEVSTSTIGINQTVQFNLYGTPNQGGTITVAANGYQQTVTVNNVTGKATVP